MADKESVKQINEHKKMNIAVLFTIAVIINGGFFPIINFNPDSPVNFYTVVDLLLIAMVVAGHAYIGTLEAAIFAKSSGVFFIGIFNIFLVECGLLGRYLLNFGEISNVYHFTIANIVFQVITLAVVSTIVCLWKRRKY